MLRATSYEEIIDIQKREIAEEISRHHARLQQMAEDHRVELAEWALGDKPVGFVVSALDIIRAPLKRLATLPGEPDAADMLKLVDKLQEEVQVRSQHDTRRA